MSSKPFKAFFTWFGALLPIVPAAAATATVALFFADWPTAKSGDHSSQVAWGLAIGFMIWVVAALLFGSHLTSVESASSETYDHLRDDVADVTKHIDALAVQRDGLAKTEAVNEAKERVRILNAELELNLDPALAAADRKEPGGSAYRWLLGYGYVNAWRNLHEAQDALLTAEPPEVIHRAAVVNLRRLTTPTTTTETPFDVKQLQELVNPKENGSGKSGGKSATSQVADITAFVKKKLALNGTSVPALPADDLAEFDKPRNRDIVRATSSYIHTTEAEYWDKIVNLRNRLFMALALVSFVAYLILAAVVLAPFSVTTLTDSELFAALMFFLVGAVVGVFQELYVTSRPEAVGTVFDYGLGQTRLLVTPVLSGIAAIAGVILTVYVGPFVVGASDQATSLARAFDLHNYPIGLVVAAIFGLAPGLVISRLTERTDDYKKEIKKLTASATGGAE